MSRLSFSIFIFRSFFVRWLAGNFRALDFLHPGWTRVWRNGSEAGQLDDTHPISRYDWSAGLTTLAFLALPYYFAGSCLTGRDGSLAPSQSDDVQPPSHYDWSVGLPCSLPSNSAASFLVEPNGGLTAAHRRSRAPLPFPSLSCLSLVFLDSFHVPPHGLLFGAIGAPTTLFEWNGRGSVFTDLRYLDRRSPGSTFHVHPVAAAHPLAHLRASTSEYHSDWAG